MARSIVNRRLFRGSTSNIVTFSIEDSSVTTGAGLTGLAFNTGSFVCYKSLDGAAAAAITLATATVGAYTSSGFKEVDATNMPGVYEFGVPNADVAGSSKFLHYQFKGAANQSPAEIRIELISQNDQAGGKPY